MQRSDNRIVSLVRTTLLRLGLAALCCAWLPGGFSQTAHWRLEGVEVEGLQTLNHDRFVALSGLEIGQAVGEEDLETAAQRLFESGFFLSVTYRYRYQGEALTAIFTVREGEIAVPVVFDNFVWFSDSEVQRAVRSQMPRFNGSAAPTDDSRRAIQDGLRLLLHGRNIVTQIQSETVEDPMTGRASAMVFRADAELPICGLRFPPTQTVAEPVLRQRAGGLLSLNYSRTLVQSFATRNLLPLFHAAGRLRAEFQTPSAVPANHPDCPTGVLVTLPVVEGYVYQWEKAEWKGATLFGESELSEMLGMVRGETADGGKIEAGLKTVRQAYASKGLTDVRLSVSPLFDDDIQRVTYRVEIEENP